MNIPTDPIQSACAAFREGTAHQAEARYADAESRYRYALQLFEKHRPSASADIANVLTKLGSVLEQQARYEEAHAHCLRAATLARNLPPVAGVLKLIRIQALAALGTLERTAGRYTDAEATYREAIAFAEQVLGPDHDEVSTLLNGLAIVFKYSGRFDEAEALYWRAVGITQAASGSDAPGLASLYHNLGGLDHARGNFAGAEPHARRSLEIRLTHEPPTSPAVAADKAALAGILDGMGRYDESEPLYREALETFERVFGREHYEVAITLNNLAGIRFAQGDLDAAESLYRQSLELKRKLLGEHHPDCAVTLLNLAVVLLRRGGNAPQALEYAEAARAIFEEKLEPSHPKLASARQACEAARNAA